MGRFGTEVVSEEVVLMNIVDFDLGLETVSSDFKEEIPELRTADVLEEEIEIFQVDKLMQTEEEVTVVHEVQVQSELNQRSVSVGHVKAVGDGLEDALAL